MLKHFCLAGALFLLALPLLTACSVGPGYYWQAASGHWQVLQAREPVTVLLEREDTPFLLKQRLRRAQTLRDFVEAELGLPAGNSYTHYADLERPYIVWNLTAAEDWSLVLHEWCFPIAGCARYQGYFSETDARRAAEAMAARGFAVDVRGVLAYSTLGWFDDPLLNTFINLPEPGFSRLIVHELSHRWIYVPHDTVFNESLATAVAEFAMEALFPPGRKLPARAATTDTEKLRALFHLQIQQLLEQLEALYRRYPEPTAQALAERSRLYRQHAAAFRKASRNLEGARSWQAFLDQPFNTARILAVQDYLKWLPAMRWQYERLDRDWPAFRTWAESLADQPREKRNAVLLRLDRQARAQRHARQS